MFNITFKGTRTINGKTIDSYELTPFKILMIGASGTGKTSLMACMNEELNNKDSVGFVFEPDKQADNGDTAKKLTNQLTKLISKVEKLKPGEEFTDNNAIVGNANQNIYYFKGKRIGEGTFHSKEFHYPIQFKDVPGGWYTDEKGTHDEDIEKYIGEAHAFLYCIDTPAMMSGESQHRLFNNAPTVRGWLQNAAQLDSLRGKSIIFILSRSEAWQCKEHELKQKFDATYGPDINLLKNAGAAVYMTPVYTLGGINFCRYGEDNHAVYKKFGSRQATKCSVPLVQLLHDGMIMYEQALQKHNANFWTKCQNMAGIKHFDLAEECARELKLHLESQLDNSITKYY